MTFPLKLPFTDPFAHLLCHQNIYSPCKDFELNFYECMEAYGITRGAKKCRDYLDDFYECATRKKSEMRMRAIVAERERQIKSGERPKDKRYLPTPPVGSYPLHGV